MKIKIDNNPIHLKENYNLVLGKFKEDHLKTQKKNLLFKEFDDFNLISLKNLLEFFKIIDPSKEKFDNIDKIINFLEIFQNISTRNISLIQNYIEILETLFSLINFNLALKNKNSLKKELELSKLKEKSSNLSAKTNLLNNLNEQIEKNRQELDYLKQDYFQFKNKKEQLEERINKLNAEIKNLNQQRKDKFSEINKITRNMEHPKNKSKIPEVSGLSNAERIKKLRKEAKEIHYKTRKIKSEINQAKNELDTILPKFKSYKKDYDALKSTIKRQEEQIKKHQNEIEKIMEETREKSVSELKMDELSNIRNYEIIEEEIKNTERKIELMINKNNHITDEKIQDFDFLLTKLSDFHKNLMENEESLIFDINNNMLISIVEDIRDFEIILRDISDLMNQFLNQINLKIDLILNIDFNRKEFFIQPKFIRNEKESLDFEGLTTPEKVFVAICLYIAIHIALHNTQIIFSNLFLHENFNKRGSLFRTLRKILPVLKEEKRFSNLNLSFLISNLEMKRPIENINIITI